MKLITILIFISFIFTGCATRFNYRPSEGYVPDAETAKKIAEAVWIPIYGRDAVESRRPLFTDRIGDIWYVSGTLPEKSPEGYSVIGSSPVAEINAKTGRILRISHE